MEIKLIKAIVGLVMVSVILGVALGTAMKSLWRAQAMEPTPTLTTNAPSLQQQIAGINGDYIKLVSAITARDAMYVRELAVADRVMSNYFGKDKWTKMVTQARAELVEAAKTSPPSR